MKNSVSEDALEKRFCKVCKENGIKTIKGNAHNNKGFPDRMVFGQKNRFIHYVELKNGTYYKQTILQAEWQKIIEESGGNYFLLNGDKEVNDYLDKYVKI